MVLLANQGPQTPVRWLESYLRVEAILYRKSPRLDFQNSGQGDQKRPILQNLTTFARGRPNDPLEPPCYPDYEGALDVLRHARHAGEVTSGRCEHLDVQNPTFVRFWAKCGRFWPVSFV